MTDNNTIHISSVLNDIRRKFDLDDFQGGSVSVILGTAHLDFRDSKIKGTEAVLDITNILSSTFIYPGSDWDVVLNITESAGSVKDKRKEKPAKPKKTLKITGITTLGSIYIR